MNKNCLNFSILCKKPDDVLPTELGISPVKWVRRKHLNSHSQTQRSGRTTYRLYKYFIREGIEPATRSAQHNCSATSNRGLEVKKRSLYVTTGFI